MPHPPRSSRRAPAAALLVLAFALSLGACADSIPLPVGDSVPTSAAPAADQPATLVGTLSYTNSLETSARAHPAVALVDLHGFVARDQSWRIPNDSLIFGRLRLDAERQSGSYILYLPAQPPGDLHDVDHDDALDRGVKIFTVSYWDDPFSARGGSSYGWPTELASTVADGEQHDEITGGKLLVWAPDGAQEFPSGFGDDGRLFSDDDPLYPLQAGYSVIDLGVAPFAIDRTASPSLPLHEQADRAVKDFSSLGYAQALRRVFEELRRDYAFNGIAGKQPEWDALYAQLAPRAAQAEQAHDPQQFYLVMRDFARAFHDGHVGLDGGARDTESERPASYGFAIRETDDHRLLVVLVDSGGPAEGAGVQKGAELIGFGGRPAAEAIGQVEPSDAPFSTELAQRLAQQRDLPQADAGASAQITFANPGQPPRSATLIAAQLDQPSNMRIQTGEADPTAPPVEYRLLDSGLGYVRINTNADDFDLTDELFARALDSFEYHKATGLIVDLRHNDGGALFGFAGYLTGAPIALAQLQYFNRGDGKFEADGPADTIIPIGQPYHFAKIAVLVDQGCYSACELEAYGFSRLPGALVVGQYPTAGVEAEVSQGQYQLPDDLWLQAPTGRYVQPDGKLFLEGQGVAPTLRVPLDQQTLLAADDVVLAAAERALR